MPAWYDVADNAMDKINADRESRLTQASVKLDIENKERAQVAAEAEQVAMQSAGALFAKLSSGQTVAKGVQVSDNASLADPFIQTGSALLADGYSNLAKSFFDQGNEIAKDERLRMREERENEKLETERSDRQIELTDRYLTNATAATWSRAIEDLIAAGSDGTINESEAAALRALPYDPEYINMLRRQAVDVAEQNKARRLELSAEDLATDRRLNRSLRMQELEVRKQTEMRRARNQPSKEGKSPKAPDEKMVNLTEAIVRNRFFGGSVPANSDQHKAKNQLIRDMSPIIAVRAQEETSRHPGITTEVAVNRAITNAINNGELSEDALERIHEAREDAEFTPKGHSRDTALPYKRGMDMEAGNWYKINTVTGEKVVFWNGTSAKEME